MWHLNELNHACDRVWSGVTHSGDHIISLLKIDNNHMHELYSRILAVCINSITQLLNIQKAMLKVY